MSAWTACISHPRPTHGPQSEPRRPRPLRLSDWPRLRLDTLYPQRGPFFCIGSVPEGGGECWHLAAYAGGYRLPLASASRFLDQTGVGRGRGRPARGGPALVGGESYHSYATPVSCAHAGRRPHRLKAFAREGSPRREPRESRAPLSAPSGAYESAAASAVQRRFSLRWPPRTRGGPIDRGTAKYPAQRHPRFCGGGPRSRVSFSPLPVRPPR